VTTSGVSELKPWNIQKITNTDPDTFSRSPEVISIQYLFTSSKGEVFLLVLQISESRGEFDK